MEIGLENLEKFAKEITVYSDGQQTTFVAGGEKFKEICVSWSAMLEGAHEMPAFSVSLNAETVKAMQSGVWAEFVFEEEYTHNEMPFEKLLINAVPDFAGFNIIRFTNERGYDGRCFYIDLVGKTMSGFYEVLTK